MKIFTVLYNDIKICEVSSPEQAVLLTRLMDSVIHLSELIFTVRIIDTEIIKNFPEHSDIITLNTWHDAVTVVDRMAVEYPGYRVILRDAAVMCSPEMALAFVATHPRYSKD